MYCKQLFQHQSHKKLRNTTYNRNVKIAANRTYNNRHFVFKTVLNPFVFSSKTLLNSFVSFRETVAFQITYVRRKCCSIKLLFCEKLQLYFVSFF